MALDLCQILVFAQYIFRTNGQNLTKRCICIDIDKIYVDNVISHFSQICDRVMALDLCQNFVSPHYL